LDVIVQKVDLKLLYSEFVLRSAMSYEVSVAKEIVVKFTDEHLKRNLIFTKTNAETVTL